MSSSGPADIEALAQTISDAAKQISSFLKEQKSSLSFDPDCPDQAPVSPETASYHVARTNLLSSASMLTDLVSGAHQSILTLSTGFHTQSALRVVYRYKLAEAVPATGSATYEEIAEKTELSATAVERLTSFLMGYRIFCQPSPGRIAHTRISYLIGTDKDINAWVGHCFEEAYPSSAHIPDALDKWGSSSEPNETGFNIYKDTTDGIWEFLAKNKDEQARFSDAMAYLAGSENAAANEVLGGFGWKDIGEATVFDVAGSTGHISIALAERCPNLNFIVQDFEPVCKKGEALCPATLRDRVKFEAHDMFQPQKRIEDKKVIYYLRQLVHDWSDKYTVKILKAHVPAMKAGDRILLNERILPEPGTADPTVEKLSRVADMQMWCLVNGQERTRKHFEKVVKDADPRLNVVNVVMPVGPGLAMIEVALEDE